MPMIKDITIGQYFPGDTIVHRLDPRVKIIIIFMFIISLFFIKNFYPYILILFFLILSIKMSKVFINYVLNSLKPLLFIITITFLLYLFINIFYPYILILFFLILSIKMSKVPINYLLKGLKPLMVIITITFLINVFMTKGVVLFQLGALTITEEGLSHGIFMALRLIFLVTGTSLLTLTTSPILLTDGIEKLLSPFKAIGLPAHELAMMMTIALRFIPTLLEETD